MTHRLRRRRWRRRRKKERRKGRKKWSGKRRRSSKDEWVMMMKKTTNDQDLQRTEKAGLFMKESDRTVFLLNCFSELRKLNRLPVSSPPEETVALR